MNNFDRLIAPPYPTVTISVYDEQHGFGGLLGTSAPTSTTFPTANRALLIPFRVFQPITVHKMWLFNGTTVVGNLDMGIFDTAGVRLGSTGSTAQAGASQIQEIALTSPVNLDAGHFFMALAMSTNTATYLRRGINNDVCAALGIAHMANAFPLPATVTFTTPTASSVPYIGMNLFNV